MKDTHHLWFVWVFAVGFVCTVSPASAAVIGYYRFESGDLRADSSGNGNSLETEAEAITPVGYPLQASGPGSDFLDPMPMTGQSNGQAASFDGDRFCTADNSGFLSPKFTIEMMFNADNVDPGYSQILAAVFTSRDDQRAWALFINSANSQLQLTLTDGSSGTSDNTESIYSGEDMTVTAERDYYVGVSVDVEDTSVNGITFYLQDLTAGGSLLSSSEQHSKNSLFGSSAPFSIGAQSVDGTPGSPFGGIIDEVRYSNTTLGPSGLLNSVPEPGTATIVVAGFALTICRRRRR